MEIKHVIAQMKPLTRLLEAIEFLQVGVLGCRSQKTQMQTTGISLCFWEWVSRYCHIYCFRAEKEDMGFKAVTLSYFSGQLFGELRSILFGTEENCVAALDISSDLSRTHSFEQDNKLFHRQRAVPANVDASEKRNVSIQRPPAAIGGVDICSVRPLRHDDKQPLLDCRTGLAKRHRSSVGDTEGEDRAVHRLFRHVPTQRNRRCELGLWWSL